MDFCNDSLLIWALLSITHIFHSIFFFLSCLFCWNSKFLSKWMHSAKARKSAAEMSFLFRWINENTCTCRTEGVRLSAWKILRFYGWGHKWSYFFLSAFLQNSFHVATIVLQLLHEAFVSLKKVTERVLLCNLFVLLLVCVRTKSHILDNRLTTELFFITLLSLFCFWLKFIFLN